MAQPIDKDYYVRKKAELMEQFEKGVKHWSLSLLERFGEIQTYKIKIAAREEFEKLIPQIPYIGGDENTFTKSLVDSVRYLALYKTMKNFGIPVEEIGKTIYDGFLKKSAGRPNTSAASKKSLERLLAGGKKGAEASQEKRYPGDYVYTYIAGNGKKFDYGFDFTECASHKLYHEHDADELLPYYCYLDFVAANVRGFGFTRTKDLYKGDGLCNHRFKADGKTKAGWPPPFLKRQKK
ncbi:MAG: L-2-amino-thiazoline-4-carboxylic acid hydrolase [Dehalococcoidales bacterium]|nr:L-2-amino-thiazoline-4-carboxylic acid hydrolase [Dehalococcoidales bacterium]